MTESRQPERAPSLRREYAIAFVAAALLYIVTAAPGVLWQDSGLAQVRALRADLVGGLGLALAHPLYYVVAIAFQAIPWFEPAYRTNLVSAVFGAVTVANVYFLLRNLTSSPFAARIGALSLAVSHTFWQFSVMAEVYTLTTALFSFELICLERFTSTSERRWLILLYLANGLNFSNHLIALLSQAVYGVLLLIWLSRRRVDLRTFVLCGLIWTAGASLYLSLVVSAVRAGTPPGDAIHSALFGDAYARQVLSTHLSAGSLGRAAMYFVLNFPTPIAALAFAGLMQLRRLRCRGFAAALVALLLIHFLWAVRYNVPDQYTFFIPAYLLVALLIGLGADRLLASLPRLTLPVLAATALPIVVYGILPIVAQRVQFPLGVAREVPFRDTYRYMLTPWKIGERSPELFAAYLAERLPFDAVLIADSTTVRPLHYERLARAWRPDVFLYPPLQRDEDPAFTPASIAQALAEDRVYVVTPQRHYAPPWLLQGGYRFVRDGLLFRVEPENP